MLFSNQSQESTTMYDMDWKQIRVLGVLGTFRPNVTLIATGHVS